MGNIPIFRDFGKTSQQMRENAKNTIFMNTLQHVFSMMSICINLIGGVYIIFME